MGKDVRDDEKNAEQLARRALLKMSAYVAPAIVGTLLMSSKNAYAATSCAPRSCQPQAPCNPATTPCSPNTKP